MCRRLTLVVSGAGDGCVHVVVVLTKCVCPCVCVWWCVCVSGNYIDAAGVTAVAEALKVNTSVQKIDLSCEW